MTTFNTEIKKMVDDALYGMLLSLNNAMYDIKDPDYVYYNVNKDRLEFKARKRRYWGYSYIGEFYDKKQ